MAYSLPPLPYDYDALEPYIDEATMRLHHDKHHQAYVTNANAALEGTEWADWSVEEVLKNLPALPTNREFGKALGRALHRPAFVPTPPLALRAMLGEVAGVIATGQRVLPKWALALGYQFRFPGIDAALTDILA